MTILDINGVTKEFDGLTALDDVNASIDEGELVALIGPNGAGKSTFVNVITGMLKPTRGEIIYSGTNIAGKEPFEIAQLGIGRSFQTASIFPELSVRDNIEIASFAAEHGSFRINFLKRRESFTDVTERTDSILESLELSEQSELTAKDLPYGEKRRLEVAIGLASDPDFLFMDEPTAGMSPAQTEMTTELIQGLLDEWGITILLIEHDMDVIFEVADRILVLHQGQLIARGTPDEIRNDPTVRKSYLGGEEI